jgi:hypothetical protein
MLKLHPLDIKGFLPANQAALPEEWKILLEPTLLQSEILNIKHRQC